MSRIGNSPITVPTGVDVKIEGQKITVKGPKGTLERDIHSNIKVEMKDNIITVSRPNDNRENRSLHGLSRTLINNMIQGVTEEFTKELEVNGVGYKAQKQGKTLVLNLGLSHQIKMEEPAGISIQVPSPNQIVIKGIDKELVGQMAANIRVKRPPEVYGGKGIKYSTERIIRKEGKAGKK